MYESIIILLFFAFTGWLITGITTWLLFKPVKPVNLGFIRIRGLIPASRENISKKAGEWARLALLNYRGFDEKMADPALLQKLRPEIESHVDHFLQVKIKAVFPLLSQFMGEKTISQFKSSLLAEIDELFPVLMQKFSGDLKNELKVNDMVKERIEAMEDSVLRTMLYDAAGKKIFLRKCCCVMAALLMGLITVSILWMLK